MHFVEVPRPAGYGAEKVNYVRYRNQGRIIEEKVGGQYRDNMTAAKAASIRGVRMEGKEATNTEKRSAVRATKVAEEAIFSRPSEECVRASLAMIVGRLVYAGSKLSLSHCGSFSTLWELCAISDIDVNTHCYAAMDKLFLPPYFQYFSG